MNIEVENNQFTIRADQSALIDFISCGEAVFHKENALTVTYAIQDDEVYVRGRVTCKDPEWRHIEEKIGRRQPASTIVTNR